MGEGVEIKAKLNFTMFMKNTTSNFGSNNIQLIDAQIQ